MAKGRHRGGGGGKKKGGEEKPRVQYDVDKSDCNHPSATKGAAATGGFINHCPACGRTWVSSS